MSKENISWLIAEGGPCIRFRTQSELLGVPARAEAKSAKAELMADPRVRELLGYLQEFDPNGPLTIGRFNAIHSSKSNSLESAVGKLIECGLRQGDREFDGVMGRFLGYVIGPQVAQAFAAPQAECTVEAGRRIFVAILVASYLLRAGYVDPPVIQLVRQRLNRIQSAATARAFEVHMDGKELGGLSKKRPAGWMNTPVLMPRHNPTTGSQPLPLIHDLYALAYLPIESLTAEDRVSISAIVKYVLDPRFQKLPSGYGLVWNEKERAYHGCGWSPHLAKLDSGLEWQEALIVQQAELFSRFEAGVDSEWMKQAKENLDRFRLPNGHYLFPRTYLQDKSYGYYAGGFRMGLETNRRTRKAFELESTFHWELISACIVNSTKAVSVISTVGEQ